MTADPHVQPPQWTPPAGSYRYSVVRSAQADSNGCTLVMEHSTKERSMIVLPCLPDRAGLDRLRGFGLTPIAVKLEYTSSEELMCSVLFRSAKGPVRREMSPGVGMAFCLDGVHTVVIHPATSLR
ncbi:hypothetical protein [Nocardioides aromaticivorans]|nr:hypothetical protein [Nocardioides aromaticivorans]